MFEQYSKDNPSKGKKFNTSRKLSNTFTDNLLLVGIILGILAVCFTIFILYWSLVAGLIISILKYAGVMFFIFL